ncbi:Na+/H+ antiporter subunit A, partial [Xanthomonas citri pv. citri]|nr:Na+/H+ antiporter subunit A [Xanthomonas citri pv. citri]
GTRDLRKLSGIGRRHPVLAAVAVAAGLSMAGLPPLFGFVAKESVLESLAAHGAAHGGVWAWSPLVVMALGSVLTFAYTWRFLWGCFAVKRDEAGETVPETQFHTRVTTLELAPAALLALVGLVLAFLPGPVEGIITAHTGSLP